MDSEDWLDLEEDDSPLDTSFPQTFSKYFANQISESLQKDFNSIANIWLSMGIPVNKRDEKIEELRAIILDDVKKFEQSEDETFQKQQKFREYQLNEVNKILKDLSLDLYVIDSGRTLLVQNKMLNLKYKELLQVKSERLDQLDRIESKFKRVCHLLGIDYQEPMFATKIPSEPELMKLRSKFMNQEQILDARKKRFESLKPVIINYQKELEYLAQNSIEHNLLSSTEIVYSQQNMTSMAEFHKKLIALFNDASLEVESLKTRLEQLFSRLDIDDSIRNEFYQSIRGTIPQKKKLLQAEIDKYELLKKSCMEKIIKNIRKDIQKFYHDCMVSEGNDHMLNSCDYSEELLVQHETEFAVISNYHQLFGAVFDKLRDWEDSMEKLFELEKKLLDPNRFTNRGGALLQNERDRKQLTKKLPKLEKEIKSLVTMIEAKNNISFNMYGLDIEQYFESNWNHFKESKDGAKKIVTQKSGADSTKKTLTPSSSQKKRFPLSQRANNNQARRAANPLASRNLFTPMGSDIKSKSRPELEPEADFQKNISDDLHSTLMDANPIVRRNYKRLSQSAGDLHAITKRPKRAPFYP